MRTDISAFFKCRLLKFLVEGAKKSAWLDSDFAGKWRKDIQSVFAKKNQNQPLLLFVEDHLTSEVGVGYNAKIVKRCVAYWPSISASE